MKKLIIAAICWPIFQMYSTSVFAQKEKAKDGNREIIIMRNSDKNSKITIETKDGEVFINGKPASEYKDDNVSVITSKHAPGSFVFTNPGKMDLEYNFNSMNGTFLGVSTEKDENGARITNVSKGSAAEKAGLKEGDVITKVDKKKINNPDDLVEAISSYKPKEEVKIYFNRNGKSDDVKATLGERKEMRAFSFNNPRFNSDERRFRNFEFTMPRVNMPPMDLMQDQQFNIIRRFNTRHIGVKIEDAENDGGAIITNVEEGSAAEKAGLKKDDIITEVNGKKVKDVRDVLDEVRNNDEKYSYTVKAKRNGSDMSFEIKIPKPKNNADL